MSMSHHSPEEAANAQRFINEIMGQSKRRWPQGRISGDDDGESAYAIAADPQNRMVRIQFSKPMIWLGLSIKEAKHLRDMLDQKIAELATAGVTE
jgi:hypothetical protein